MMREDWSIISDAKRAELFPIVLEAHNPRWKEYYAAESLFLREIFEDCVVRMSHIGSTAVAGLLAKPTIDILLEISDDSELQPITEKLLDAGYVVNNPKDDIVMYIKGYTPRGFEGQAVHIHVRYSADWGELYFRDYLTLHADVASEYERLKVRLKEQFTHDRDGYTDAKGAFIKKHTQQARLEFPGRYTPEIKKN
ncbi:MAG: GrpB family protein [Dehalococcoidia bacterium]|nr:GrpB family protein [Dehalococcoidia bacterium]